MAVAESPDQVADSFVRSPHKLLIDGEWVQAASGKTFATLNPATEETLTEVAHGQAEDIERAVRAARKAFADDSPWRRMNASDRGRMIWRIADLIEQHGDELAMLESLDNGKPYGVARVAEGDAHARRQLPLLHPARAGRRRRADHPVELPAADGRVETGPGTGHR